MKNPQTQKAVDAFRNIIFSKGYFGKTFISHVTYYREGHEDQVGMTETNFDGDTQSGHYGNISIGYFGEVTKQSGHYVLFSPRFANFSFENGCLTVIDTGKQPGREGDYRVEIRPQ